jgi:peroxiredoxin
MRVAPEMFDEMIDFAKRVKEFSKLTLTIVGLDEIDTEKAKKFAEEVIGVSFRERTYFS